MKTPTSIWLSSSNGETPFACPFTQIIHPHSRPMTNSSFIQIAMSNGNMSGAQMLNAVLCQQTGSSNGQTHATSPVLHHSTDINIQSTLSTIADGSDNTGSSLNPATSSWVPAPPVANGSNYHVSYLRDSFHLFADSSHAISVTMTLASMPMVWYTLPVLLLPCRNRPMGLRLATPTSSMRSREWATSAMAHLSKVPQLLGLSTRRPLFQCQARWMAWSLMRRGLSR